MHLGDLEFSDLLLLPFPYDGQPTDSLTRTKGIRAKLRENQLHPLNGDMRQLRNLIKDNGLKVL